MEYATVPVRDLLWGVFTLGMVFGALLVALGYLVAWAIRH